MAPGRRPSSSREGGDRARPQVITVRKSSWEDDTIDIFEVMLFMPEEYRVLLEDVSENEESVVVTVGTRKNNDSKFQFSPA